MYARCAGLVFSLGHGAVVLLAVAAAYAIVNRWSVMALAVAAFSLAIGTRALAKWLLPAFAA